MAPRTAIIEALRGSSEGLDANALAEAVALHANTVRWHLGVLSDQGLVTSAPEHRQGRGRPSVVYRLTPDGIVQGRDEYRLLATMLTAALAGDSNAEARCYETGLRWGRFLSRPGEGQAVRRTVALLEEEGFAAEGDEQSICMRRCPFYALAETNPEIVCTLHRGIIDGALEQAGATVGVTSLRPFVEPQLCVAELG